MVLEDVKALVEDLLGSKGKADQSQLKVYVLAVLLLLRYFFEQAQHRIGRQHTKNSYFFVPLDYPLGNEVQKLEVSELDSQYIELLSQDK